MSRRFVLTSLDGNTTLDAVKVLGDRCGHRLTVGQQYTSTHLQAMSPAHVPALALERSWRFGVSDVVRVPEFGG